MKTTMEIIHKALAMSQKPAIAYSGGTDSNVLLHLIYSRTSARPPVVFADSQMEYETTLPFIEAVCKRYGAELHIARANRTPQEQWAKCGFPMLGKLAARHWSKSHRGRGFGFKIDVSSCCRNMKIGPARKAMRALGIDLHFTGQRGATDDALRGLRALKDGAISYLKADKLHVCNPLLGWSDMMIRRYSDENALPIHPAKTAGACTIGCLFCGGGAQFTNSGFKILRHALPDAWKRFVVDWKAGEIILSIKHDKPLPAIRRAVERLGGLEYLAASHHWIFDFLRETPLEGYQK